MSLLGSASQGLGICLRCQLSSNLKRSFHPSRRRRIGAPSHPRALTSSVKKHQEDPHLAREIDHPSPSPSQARNFSPEDEPYGSSRPPKRQLGVESFGTPAEILVMNDIPRRPRNLGVIFTEEEPIEPFPPALEGSSEALIFGINSTRGIVDYEHVRANIDTIRDDFWKNKGMGGQHVSSEEYDELVSKLIKGFEKKHLAQYWHRSLSTSVVDALDLSTPYNSTLLSRTEWYTEAQFENHVSAAPLVNFRDIQKNPQEENLFFLNKAKQWHAENVVQRCWGLRKEPGVKTGEMVMRIPHIHLKLLLGHVNNPVGTISQTYSVKLHVNKRKGVIRVEADYSTCEDVLRMLMRILNCVQSSHISLNNSSLTAPTKDLDNRFIEKVEELTNTIILRERGTNIDEYKVHYLGPEASDLEDAVRLLNNGAHEQIANPGGDVWVEALLNPTISAVPKEFGESLPLVARNTQWARFVDEDGRRFESEGKIDSPLPNDPSNSFPYSDLVIDQVYRFYRFLNHRRQNRSHVKDTSDHWEPTLTRSSQVVLGQVAFPLRQAQRLEGKLKEAKTNTELALGGIYKSIARLERVFATTLPGMTRALEAASSSFRPVERLEIRMVPVSADGLSPDYISLVPKLEILVEIHLRENLVQLQSARLMLMHDELDLLLPSHATDLRLMRRQYLYCNYTDVDQYDQKPSDPSLMTFIEESHLDIWGSQRLKTPNHLLLSIPRSLIPVSAADGEIPDLSNGILVNYKFASIEHRSTVSLAPIGRFTPEYNTIQAGKTGGRREELTIRLGRQVSVEGRPWAISSKTSKGLLEAASQVSRSMR